MKNIWNFSLFTTLLSMFYFRKLELILRFNELTANDAQCLSSKDTYSIAHSFKQLLLSIYLGVDKIKNICTKQSLFQTDNRNCGFYLILTNAFHGNKNNSSALSLGQDYLFYDLCIFLIS